MTNYGPSCPDCINHLDKDQCPTCGFVLNREDPYWTAARYRKALEQISEIAEANSLRKPGQIDVVFKDIEFIAKQALEGETK